MWLLPRGLWPVAAHSPHAPHFCLCLRCLSSRCVVVFCCFLVRTPVSGAQRHSGAGQATAHRAQTHGTDTIRDGHPRAHTAGRGRTLSIPHPAPPVSVPVALRALQSTPVPCARPCGTARATGRRQPRGPGLTMLIHGVQTLYCHSAQRWATFPSYLAPSSWPKRILSSRNRSCARTASVPLRPLPLPLNRPW